MSNVETMHGIRNGDVDWYRKSLPENILTQTQWTIIDYSTLLELGLEDMAENCFAIIHKPP